MIESRKIEISCGQIKLEGIFEFPESVMSSSRRFGAASSSFVWREYAQQRHLKTRVWFAKDWHSDIEIQLQGCGRQWGKAWGGYGGNGRRQGGARFHRPLRWC